MLIRQEGCLRMLSPRILILNRSDDWGDSPETSDQANFFVKPRLLAVADSDSDFLPGAVSGARTPTTEYPLKTVRFKTFRRSVDCSSTCASPQGALPSKIKNTLDWIESPMARNHPWPGNVRELHNTLRNLLLGLQPGLRQVEAGGITLCGGPGCHRSLYCHAASSTLISIGSRRPLRRQSGSDGADLGHRSLNGEAADQPGTKEAPSSDRRLRQPRTFAAGMGPAALAALAQIVLVSVA